VWHIWIRTVLCNVAFFELLLSIDRELLEEAWKQPCPLCGGRLDRGDYPRKPRGQPAGAPESFATRLSLCCAEDGCRHRLTPFSVRYLGRKVYVGVAVVLVAAAMQGPSPARLQRLCELLGMARRTARRWLAWWRGAFSASDFFKSIRGLLRQPLLASELPLGLLDLLHQSRPAETTLAALRLLEPITSASAPGAQPV
jgi:hypothetical protein